MYAAELIYVTSMSFTKIGILFFYYRIFRYSLRFHTAVWVMGTIIVCWYFTSVFVGCFQCHPARYLWDRTIPGGQCLPEDTLWIGSSVSSLVTDAAIWCLPMPIIWRMRATWQQRLAISAVFLLGALYANDSSNSVRKESQAEKVRSVCVTSILRLTTISQLSITDSTSTPPSGRPSSAPWPSSPPASRP